MNDDPTEGEVRAYYQGLRDGLWLASWRHRFVDYIGEKEYPVTSSTRLSKELERIDAEEFGKLQLARR